MSGVIQCRKCGYTLPEETLFCNKCGAKVMRTGSNMGGNNKSTNTYSNSGYNNNSYSNSGYGDGAYNDNNYSNGYNDNYSNDYNNNTYEQSGDEATKPELTKYQKKCKTIYTIRAIGFSIGLIGTICSIIGIINYFTNKDLSDPVLSILLLIEILCAPVAYLLGGGIFKAIKMAFKTTQFAMEAVPVWPYCLFAGGFALPLALIAFLFVPAFFSYGNFKEAKEKYEQVMYGNDYNYD